MREVLIETKGSRVLGGQIQKLLAKLAPAVQEAKTISASADYSSPQSFLKLPVDKNLLHAVKKAARDYTRVDALVVIGIGGSELGTLAVQQAIGLQHQKLLVHYLDSVDPAIMRATLEQLKHNKHVLVNIITKSGTTTESIANATILLHELEKRKTKHHIVVTTTCTSKLAHWASQNKIPVLHIPEQVSGRFSVFTPVGLFPLAVMGVNLQELRAGATQMLKRCLRQENNPATLSAAHLYTHVMHGDRIHETFLFSQSLEALGKWYRQLMAESLGKARTLGNKKVRHAFTPTVAVGTTDLHSELQLTLTHGSEVFTTFVTVMNQPRITIPQTTLSQLVPGLAGKKLAKVREAIFHAVQHVYVKHQLPFVHIELPDQSANSIGQFLQFKMMETLYLGALLDVNVFDQPAVEEYKERTRELLSS